MAEVRDTQNKQTTKPENDSVADKLLREADLLIDGTKKGIADAAKDAWAHPGTSLLKLGGSAVMGAGLALMHGRGGMLKIGAEVAGAAFGFSFLTDVSGRAQITADAMADTWRSAARLEQDKQIVAKTTGPLVMDTALMGLGGVAGARVSRVPAINRALYSGLDNIQSRIPTTAFLKENAQLKLLDQYHPEYGQHSRRVGQYASMIADEMGLPRTTRVGVAHAGKMHDIGKLDIPLDILNKPSGLTDAEYTVIKAHPQKSLERLSALGYKGKYADIPTWASMHHERLDGLGYYQGLKGDQIPLEARILKVADVFDAVTSPREYHSGRMPLDSVKEIMDSGIGSEFDPAVLDAFRRVRADKIARVLGSDEKMPSLKPLKRTTLGDMLESVVDPDNKPAFELFRKIYKRELKP